MPSRFCIFNSLKFFLLFPVCLSFVGRMIAFSFFGVLIVYVLACLWLSVFSVPLLESDIVC